MEKICQNMFNYKNVTNTVVDPIFNVRNRYEDNINETLKRHKVKEEEKRLLETIIKASLSGKN